MMYFASLDITERCPQFRIPHYISCALRKNIFIYPLKTLRVCAIIIYER